MHSSNDGRGKGESEGQQSETRSKPHSLQENLWSHPLNFSSLSGSTLLRRENFTIPFIFFDFCEKIISLTIPFHSSHPLDKKIRSLFLFHPSPSFNKTLLLVSLHFRFQPTIFSAVKNKCCIKEGKKICQICHLLNKFHSVNFHTVFLVSIQLGIGLYYSILVLFCS